MQFWFSTTEATIEATQHHVEGIVANMDDYLAVRPRLYPQHDEAIESMRPWAERQKRGDAVVWITFEGWFWFPRTLMNIERQMYAFYDQPELIHRINQDLTDFHIRTLHKIAEGLRADVHDVRRGHVVQSRPDDLPRDLRRVPRPLLPPVHPADPRTGHHPDRRHRRRRDADGAVAAGRRHLGRAAAGTPGGRGRDEASPEASPTCG